MKKFFLIAFILLFSISLKAETTKILVVEMKDNSTVEFVLNENPIVKFLSESITIATSTLNGQYEYDKVRNLHFEEKDLSGIKSTKLSENTLRIIYNGTNSYTVVGLKATDKIMLYNLSGQKLGEKTATEGSATLSLQDQAAGTYIINIAGKHSFKVIKK